MKKRPFDVNRICLGSAQCGMDYGVNNTRGRIPREEAFEIFSYAHHCGIDSIDTASAYGESEKVLGEYIERETPGFKVISKLAPLEDNRSFCVDASFRKSLDRLKLNKLYGYLIHKFDNYVSFKEIWPELSQLKKQGLVEKIGFSLYHPVELERLFSENVDFDIVQLPYSVFDRRFGPSLKRLKAKGIEIHARSVFLQGLAFLSPDHLPGRLSGAQVSLQKLRRLSDSENISINALCLNFALLNPCVDRVVMGVDGLGHLKANLDDVTLTDKVGRLSDKLDMLRIDNEDILLPYRWQGAVS